MAENKYKHLINRDLSWLKFNERVLEEAEDHSNPLFERLNFMAIYHSNLSEFLMVDVYKRQAQHMAVSNQVCFFIYNIRARHSNQNANFASAFNECVFHCQVKEGCPFDHTEQTDILASYTLFDFQVLYLMSVTVEYSAERHCLATNRRSRNTGKIDIRCQLIVLRPVDRLIGAEIGRAHV